jgi:hypothetical protein
LEEREIQQKGYQEAWNQKKNETVPPPKRKEISQKIYNVGEMFVNKQGTNGFWYCPGYCCLVPSLLGAARRHPEVVHSSL